jgi:hypothetical protein
MTSSTEMVWFIAVKGEAGIAQLERRESYEKKHFVSFYHRCFLFHDSAGS